MSDAFQTYGAFSWSELRTGDVAGAKKFYADVFGWGSRTWIWAGAPIR